MRRVQVYWWRGDEKVSVAEISERNDGRTAMVWDEQFLQSEVELSPYQFKKRQGVILLPQQPFNGLPGLFNDYVPDGFGQRLLRRAFGRQGLAATEVRPLDMLQYIGDRGMGALTFEPALHDGETWAGREVDLDELSAAVEPVLAGSPSAVIDEFIAGGASPNGMRPKFLATEHEGKFYVGSDESIKGDRWIVKFPAEIDPPDIAKIEFVYSQMAKQAGLNVADARLFETKSGCFFGSRRFDRSGKKRFHMHTVSGMLGVSPGNYSVSYENFATLTRLVTRRHADVEEVFKLATFNVLASNQDDHLKNVAYLMDEHGEWRLAPAYDLTYCRTRHGHHKMTVNGSGAPGHEDLLAMAGELGISQSRAKVLKEQVVSGVAEFRRFASEVELKRSETKRIWASLSPGLR